MAFPLDSYTSGVSFHNLSASIKGSAIHLEGQFTSSDFIPILLFSVGVPWMRPLCQDPCCLWDMARRYMDTELASALGPTCNASVLSENNPRLMKSARSGPTTWTLDTNLHPSFVAMLFVCLQPRFELQYGIMPISWADSSTVMRWSASWAGQPCHQVRYPDGRQVCIACFNSKPDKAVFVFSADWFNTFQCQWACEPGYLGPNCEVPLDLVVYLSGGIVGVALVVLMIVCRSRGGSVKAVKSEPAQAPVITTSLKSEMITFKEGMEIRIKLL